MDSYVDYALTMIAGFLMGVCASLGVYLVMYPGCSHQEVIYGHSSTGPQAGRREEAD